MRRRFCLLMSLLAVCATGLAGTVKGSFGQGVLGIAWGTSLTSVVGVYPQGDHVFAVTPGCRAYWVKEGQPFLGYLVMERVSCSGWTSKTTWPAPRLHSTLRERVSSVLR